MSAFDHGGSPGLSVTDFSANINPLGLHPAALEALRRLSLQGSSSPALVRYPETDAASFCALAADYWGLAPASVAAGAGAVDIIYALSDDCAARGKQALVVEPAFSEYAFSFRRRGEGVKSYALSEKNGFSLSSSDLASLSALLDASVGLLFFASPANPSGAVASEALLTGLARLCEEKKVIFVYDACFVQFSEPGERALRSLLSRLQDFPHLLVLNTLTKFYGMPGVRLGYALCGDGKTAARIRALDRLHDPHRVRPDRTILQSSCRDN